MRSGVTLTWHIKSSLKCLNYLMINGLELWDWQMGRKNIYIYITKIINVSVIF